MITAKEVREISERNYERYIKQITDKLDAFILKAAEQGSFFIHTRLSEEIYFEMEKRKESFEDFFKLNIVPYYKKLGFDITYKISREGGRLWITIKW